MQRNFTCEEQNEARWDLIQFGSAESLKWHRNSLAENLWILIKRRVELMIVGFWGVKYLFMSVI